MPGERDASTGRLLDAGAEPVDPADVLSAQGRVAVQYIDTASERPEIEAAVEAECVVLTAHRADGEWTDIVSRVRSAAPSVPIVLVTPETNEPLARAAVGADIDGFVNLDAESTETLVETVESVVTVADSGQRDAHYRQLAEHAGDPICLLDTDGTLLLCNQALSELLGTHDGDLVGTHIGAFVPDADVDQARELLGDLTTADRRYGVIESRIEPPDGDPIPCEATVAPAGSATAGSPRSVVVIRDLTGRNQHREELEQQNERLAEFVDVVSHDIRNPLAVAMSRLELLALDTDSEHLDEIDVALTRIEDIIDDLLSVARSGTTAEEIQPVSVRATAEDAWTLVETGDATLTVDVDREIEAEPSRLQQLFENLFRNAIEHTDSAPTLRIGPIEPIGIATRSETDVEPTGFYVADNGPGIPPDKRESVFEYGETGSDGGTGFGLAIVKDIVTEHDWQVHVTGTATGGARFEIDGVSFV